MKLALAATLLATAYAACPGADGPCSGHGSCGNFDKCTCYRNWQGNDCSERTCSFSTSWNTVAQVTGTATTYEHGYAECSSKGECDRKSGQCKCFDGYTGVSCRRMRCDEDCNGHGTCETLDRIESGYTGWDAAKIQKCVCDPGFEGDDCASKKCKKGDDPMTLANFASNSWTAQTAEIQQIAFTTAGTIASGDTYTITYTDWRGQDWTTWALDMHAGTAIEIKEALESLPNQAIPSVEVSITSAFGGSGGTARITFSDAMNSGDQAMITVTKTACNTAGCQPMLVGSANGAVAVTEVTKGTTEWAVCSNRGTCNSDTGDCECFSGYTGEACQIQTIIT